MLSRLCGGRGAFNEAEFLQLETILGGCAQGPAGEEAGTGFAAADFNSSGRIERDDFDRYVIRLLSGDEDASSFLDDVWSTVTKWVD